MPWQFRDRYIENSPILYLDRMETPLLIVQGELDRNVPLHRAEEVFVGLRRLGKKFVYANTAARRIGKVPRAGERGRLLGAGHRMVRSVPENDLCRGFSSSLRSMSVQSPRSSGSS